VGAGFVTKRKEALSALKTIVMIPFFLLSQRLGT
jgi:hypothetical protein